MPWLILCCSRGRQKAKVMARFFHLTDATNVDSIMSSGLQPRMGDRSLEFGELEPAIFLFRTLADAEYALSNWLGEAFDGVESLALLQVELAVPAGDVSETLDLEQRCDDGTFEHVVKETIPPAAISVLTMDADNYNFYGEEDDEEAVHQSGIYPGN